MKSKQKLTAHSKPWEVHAKLFAYEEESKEIKQSFLIVCEGTNTEKFYFESFPLYDAATVKAVSQGTSDLKLVEFAIEESGKAEYDQVWCVFDYDHNPENETQAEDFDQAILNAKGGGFKVAYSNDCFELWFILHYEDVNAKSIRSEHFEWLTSRWGKNYEKKGKSKAFAKRIYALIEEDESADQAEAIRRAKRLLYNKRTLSPYKQNPVTTVHLLVKELIKFLRK